MLAVVANGHTQALPGKPQKLERLMGPCQMARPVKEEVIMFGFVLATAAARAKTFRPHHLNMNNHQVFSRVSFLLLWINKLMGCGNACGHGIAIKRAKKGP